MVSNRLRTRFYPDDSREGDVEFYGWVRRFITRQTVLLNLGAGPPADRGARVLKGEAARVVGVDIDPEVLHNTADLDEAHVIDGDGVLPFPDDNFDLALSDWVAEHVEQPRLFLREVCRVLKPGGSFFMRTPNKHHYVGLIARTTPEWFHRLVANWARGCPTGAHEPWPTYYRLNARSVVETEGRNAGFGQVEVQMWEPPPYYLVFHAAPFMVGVGYERIVNRYRGLAGLRANIHCRMIK